MKPHLEHKLLLVGIFSFCSCSTPKNIHNISSINRQKEIRKTPSNHVFGDILIGSVNNNIG